MFYGRAMTCGRMSPEAAFSAVLLEARERKGLTRKELGALAGYHTTYIGMLERGRMNPTLRALCSIASALEVPAAELVNRVEHMIGGSWHRKRHPAQR